MKSEYCLTVVLSLYVHLIMIADWRKGRQSTCSSSEGRKREGGGPKGKYPVGTRVTRETNDDGTCFKIHCVGGIEPAMIKN